VLGLAVLASIAVAATGEGGAGGVSAEALADGYRSGFRWALVLLPPIVLAISAIPRPEPHDADLSDAGHATETAALADPQPCVTIGRLDACHDRMTSS
jgi:hypothetical protein